MEKLRENAHRAADRRDLRLVDHLHLGRADLVILRCGLSVRADSPPAGGTAVPAGSFGGKHGARPVGSLPRVLLAAGGAVQAANLAVARPTAARQVIGAWPSLAPIGWRSGAPVPLPCPEPVSERGPHLGRRCESFGAYLGGRDAA
jgi:hypothetical protein